jgi:DNA-binding transcriptional ArsR family regulator
MQVFYCMFVYVRDEQLDLIFKTLGDATRRRILDLLQERSERSLFEICASFAVADGKSLSRQTISQHLDMLERAGLIITSWKGRTKTHSLNVAPMQVATNQWLKKYL